MRGAEEAVPPSFTGTRRRRTPSDNSEEAVYAMSVFRCIMECGRACCSFRSEVECPLVYPWEKRFIESKRSGERFKPYLSYRAGRGVYVVVLYRWVINGECAFLVGNQCSIHSAKPRACRMFPLIVNLGDGTLRVSEACPYVAKEEALKDPRGYFRDEYPVAVRSYVMLRVIDAFARSNRWVLTINPTLSGGARAVDIDAVIDTEDLERRVEESLTEQP